MKNFCVLSSWLFNQYVPDSKIFKGFLIRKNKYYCLHVWVEYEIEIYDIINMYNIRTMPMFYLLGPPHFVIKEPILLENEADDQKEFSLQLKISTLRLIIGTPPNMLKNVLKVLKEKL